MAAAHFFLVQRPPAILHNSIPGLATTILRLKSIHRRLGLDFTATRQEAVGSRAAKAGCLHHKLPAARPPKEDPQTVLPAVPSVAGISYQTAHSYKYPYTIVQQPSSRFSFPSSWTLDGTYQNSRQGQTQDACHESPPGAMRTAAAVQGPKD